MNASNAVNFGAAEESIDWAKSDIADLNAGFSEFFTQDNITFVTEIDERTGYEIAKIKVADRVPMSKFKRSAVNALMHSRNCFDQAVNIAGMHITGKRFKRNFPWSDSLTDLEGHRLKGFPENLRSAIKSLEPYPRGDSYTGGSDLIRALARLCNNKHSIGFSIDMLGGIDFGGAVKITGMGTLESLDIFPPNWDPDRQEVVLWRIGAEGVGLELNDNTRLGFNVCFEIPELSNLPEVRFALHEFLVAAERSLKLVKTVCGK